MSISFDGAFTSWRSVNASAPIYGAGPAFTVQDEAKAYADTVISKFENMQREAARVAQSALSYIEACAAFTVTPTQIDYVSPAFTAPTFTSFPTDVTFDIDIGGSPSSTVEAPPRLRVNDRFALQAAASGAAPSNAITKPNTVTITPQTTVPSYNEESYEFDIEGNPPQITAVRLSSVREPEAPDIETDLGVEGTFVTPADYTLPAGLEDGIAEIETAKASLETLINGLPDIPTYTPVFGSIFACVGGLLSDLPFTPRALEITASRDSEYRLEFGNRVQALWPEAALPADTLATQSVWLGTEDTRFADQASVRRAAAGARAVNDAKVLAFQLGTAAHKIGMDIVLGGIKAELTYLSGLMDAMGSWYQAVGSAYAGAIALFEARAETQTIGYTMEEFRVQQYEVDVGTQVAKGQINSAKADLFAIQERAKAIPMQGFKAALQRERAKVEAFAASKEADVGKTAKLEADLHKFKAKCLEWSGNAAKLAAEYKLAIAKIAATQQQNQALVDAESAGTAKYSADSAAIAAEAASAEAVMQRLQSGYMTLGLELVQKNALNAVAGLEAKEFAFGKTREFQELATALNIKAGSLEGRASFNNEVLTYLKTVSDAAYRAASQAQQANNQLVTAYSNAQKAAGDASAAIESGKWSGWNVTASAKAAGNLSGQTQYGSQAVENLTNEITESDTATQES